MIIVTGSVVVRSDARQQAIALALAHVRRSRAEEGCLSHSVHHDTENDARLFFFEEWRDRAALAAHFALPASHAFVKSLSALAVEPPSLRVFEAAPVAL